MTDEQNSSARRRRVPYFERPRPPRDWRFWVGGLGRTMIILGLLVFAFVAYQLWGTGIQTARAQRTLRGEFAQTLSSTTTTTTTTVVSTTSTLPPFPPSDVVDLGQPIAHLQIPSIKLDYMVVEGVRVRDLQRGPGHFPESKQPGQLGNAAFACHRTTYGAPCYDLDHIAVGDEIRLTTQTGTYVYRATGSEVVPPSEYRLVVPTADRNTATLAIATCTPIGTARDRLVVHAMLDRSLSDPVFSGTTGTVAPVTTTATTPANVSTSTVSASTVSTTIAPTTTTDPAAALGSDAFTQGWFESSSLTAQFAFWAAAAFLVVATSYQVGRRFRRVWVCFAVGVLPFVITLYFTFENLNLLLPAGL